MLHVQLAKTNRKVRAIVTDENDTRSRMMRSQTGTTTGYRRNKA